MWGVASFIIKEAWNMKAERNFPSINTNKKINNIWLKT